MNAAKQIVDCINRVYSNGLTTTSGGNLSIMDEEGNIFITPSGKDKGTLVEADITKVTQDGEVFGLKPSIELPFHSLIYKLRPDVKAVLHVHSPFLVSYSLLNSAPNIKVLPNFYASCGKVGLSLYDIPGSIDLGRQIAKFIEQGYDSVMMQNHGVVLVAATMAECYKMLESLEVSAEICLKAKMLGNTNGLDDNQIAAYVKSKDQLNTATKEAEIVQKGCGCCCKNSYEEGEEDARKSIIAFVKRCYKHRFFSVNCGTISLKIADDCFLITPENYDRNDLSLDSIVKVKGGALHAKGASTSWALHREIYNNKLLVNSIFEACSPNIMAYAVSGKPISSRTIPESYIMMRDMARLPYCANFGDANAVVNAITPSTPVLLMDNTCVLTTGESIIKAFDRLEVSDVTAKNLILTTVLGQPCDISDFEIDKIDKAFNLAK